MGLVLYHEKVLLSSSQIETKILTQHHHLLEGKKLRQIFSFYTYIHTHTHTKQYSNDIYKNCGGKT